MQRFWRRQKQLTPGSVACLVLLVTGIGCKAEPYLAAYLIASDQVANETSENREPVLGLFEARFRECSDCREINVELPAGETLSVRPEPKPRLTLSADEINEVRLAEVRSVFDPTIRTWIALAIPSEDAKKRIGQLSREFPFDTVLIEIDGNPTDVHSIATWSGGIRLAVFREREELEEFAGRLKVRTSWLPFNEEEFERNRQESNQR